MYLVTTALREFWPESGPIWLLSPGCSPNPDDHEVESRWEIKGIVSDPFQNAQKTTVAYTEIWRIANDLISLLASRLNVIHKTNHSERYWRTHIGFWALLFVTVVFDRHARLLKAKSEIDNVMVIGCNDANRIVPSDTINFVFEVKNDFYNCQIYTFLCRKLGIPFIEYCSENIISHPEKLLNPKHSRVKNGFKKLMSFGHTALAFAFARRADVLMVSPYLAKWFQIALAFVTGGRVFSLPVQKPIDVHSSYQINSAARSALGLVPEGYEGIAALVVAMIEICIPKSFVEEYQQLCWHSDSTYKNYQPKAIYSANSWWYDESFKHWAAKCNEQGTKLIGGEHGSAAFVNKYKIAEALEILISDYFLTWGWTDIREPKAVQVPANKLINLSRRFRRIANDSILYVCTAEARHNVGMLEDFSDYLEWQKRFVKSIPHDLIEKVLIRMHYHDYGWKMKDRLLKGAPTLRFDSWDISFRKRLGDSRLFVFDYISTTFAETLSSNVPTILFSDETRYPIIETMIPHFQALKDARILHDTPENAAAWVAHVYDDPAPWWLSESCQRAVKDFCNLYARTSETPLRDWKRTFEALVSR